MPLVLAKTHFGAVFGARTVALVSLALSSRSSSRSMRTLSFLAASGVAATVALSGHAADWGDLRPIASSDWLHIVASAVWIGGLVSLCVVFPRGSEEPYDARFLAQVALRFSRLAGVCVPVVVATGIANLLAQVQAVSALWHTTYGEVLTAKLLLVAGLVALGAINRYRVVPRLVREAETPHDARRSDPVSPIRGFARYVAAEVALAAFVFACTSLLGQLGPPRHDPSGHLGAANGSLHGRRGGREMATVPRKKWRQHVTIEWRRQEAAGRRQFGALRAPR
jgi:putative copper export protein